MDVGPAKWSFATNKFSWASGTSNMTLNLPSLTVAVAGTGCAVAQSSSWAHNTTVYTWSFSGASACNGVALTTAMKLYVKNVTGAYNKKEVIITGTTTRAGATKGVVNTVLFPLVSTGSIPYCSSAYCYSVQAGSAAFNWSGLSAFTRAFNNSTKTLSVSSGSSTASITSYKFDPLAIDGTPVIGSSTGSSATTVGGLTTSYANDVIIAIVKGAGSTIAISAVTDGNGVLTFHSRYSQTSPRVFAIWYAIASSTLSNDKITGTQDSANAGIGVQGFAISGANTVSPFDSNAGLPFSASGASGTTPTVTGVSTSNADDIILGMMGSGSLTVQTAGSGYALVQEYHDSSFGSANSEDKIVSSTQSSVTVAFGQTSSNAGWSMVVDAIVQASTTVTLSRTDTVTLLFSVAYQPNDILLRGDSVTLPFSVAYSQFIKTFASYAATLPFAVSYAMYDILGRAYAITLPFSTDYSKNVKLFEDYAVTLPFSVDYAAGHVLQVLYSAALPFSVSYAVHDILGRAYSASLPFSVSYLPNVNLLANYAAMLPFRVSYTAGHFIRVLYTATLPFNVVYNVAICNIPLCPSVVTTSGAVQNVGAFLILGVLIGMVVFRRRRKYVPVGSKKKEEGEGPEPESEEEADEEDGSPES